MQNLGQVLREQIDLNDEKNSLNAIAAKYLLYEEIHIGCVDFDKKGTPISTTRYWGNVYENFVAMSEYISKIKKPII